LAKFEIHVVFSEINLETIKYGEQIISGKNKKEQKKKENKER